MKIGEVASRAGVSQRMVRHYESIGLIPRPLRRDSGYRDYSDEDLHRLRFIANARDLGFPIEEIRALLTLWSDRDRSSADVKHLALAHIAALEDKMRALGAMQKTLRDLADSCRGDSHANCPIIEALAGNDDSG